MARASGSRSGGKAETPDLQKDLRDFAAARPQGWSHEDWLNFLEYLKGRGHDTAESDRIGARLERERIAVALEGVEGLGPKRLDALQQRFGNLWHLKNATAEQIAELPSINRGLAERISERLAG